MLTQALLQTQNPDIQAKLLAMQKQMQQSGVSPSTQVFTDDFSLGRMSPPLLPVRTPAMLAHDARQSKLTYGQKEEQTRFEFINNMNILHTHLLCFLLQFQLALNVQN